MKPWMKWTALALLLALLALGVLRALSARKAREQALAVTARAPDVVELAPTDAGPAQTREMVLGVAVSGTLRARESAFVKARVAGELQGLTLREGDAVKAGQVIGRIEPLEYQARFKQAQEQAAAAGAQVDIARRQYDDNQALVRQGFISKAALETSANNLQAARASQLAAQAGADVARKALDDTVLRAPIDGLVAQRLAQPGERLAVDARIVEIVDLRRLEVEAPLAAADAVALRVGQSARLRVEGLEQPLEARVTRIGPSAQVGSRSVLAYLGLDTTTGLRQGLFVQGRIETGRASGVAVPLEALRTDRPAPYVQVVEDGRVAHRPVQPGARGEIDGQDYVLVRGLPAGAQVIAGSVGRLRAGSTVRFTRMR